MIGLNDLLQHKMPQVFFDNNNVQLAARQLLGKVLVTNFCGQLTAGTIVETEAYNGATDRASHAYGNRRTARTAVMFGKGGKAYVYLCYGIHHLMNVVIGDEEVPRVVLIRALQPLVGVEVMLQRTGKTNNGYRLARGPGSLCKAMGINTGHSGADLQSDEIFLADVGSSVADQQIVATPRIGVDYAGSDALLPYRFIVQNNPHVSGSRKLNNPGR